MEEGAGVEHDEHIGSAKLKRSDHTALSVCWCALFMSAPAAALNMLGSSQEKRVAMAHGS